MSIASLENAVCTLLMYTVLIFLCEIFHKACKTLLENKTGQLFRFFFRKNFVWVSCRRISRGVDAEFFSDGSLEGSLCDTLLLLTDHTTVLNHSVKLIRRTLVIYFPE